MSGTLSRLEGLRTMTNFDQCLQIARKSRGFGCCIGASEALIGPDGEEAAASGIDIDEDGDDSPPDLESVSRRMIFPIKLFASFLDEVVKLELDVFFERREILEDEGLVEDILPKTKTTSPHIMRPRCFYVPVTTIPG